MTQIKNNWYLFLMLILMILISIFFIWDFNTANATKLDEVKLKENNQISKGLAIMLENDTNDGKYAESESSMWPSSTDYRFNKELSGCIDNDGNTIEDALTYNKSTNSVSIKTKSNISCYMYFDLKFYLSELCKSGDTLGSCLTDNNEEIDSLNNNIEGGLYRYQGTNIDVDDNYICFGTGDKEECTSNTDAYMYRIIGIDNNGQLKLIKKEALNEKLHWHTDTSVDTNWQNSNLFSNINGEKYLTNSTYMPNGWSNKIVDYNWKYGDINSSNLTAFELYTAENNWKNTISAKIGLMYGYDYAYAYQRNGLNCSDFVDHTSCKISWLFIANNDIESPNQYEWTMTRYGLIPGYNFYGSWGIHEGGGFSYWGTNGNDIVRPVFYLNSDEQYISGDGTLDNPIMLKEPKQLSELCESGDNLGSCLTGNNKEIYGLDDTAYSGMYRYTGKEVEVPNNYICFGTIDKEECINNPDTYMYRVIGVTSEANDTLGLETNQLKLIKHTLIGTHQWHSDSATDTKWENSSMYTYLQNDVLKNTIYYPNGWIDKIDNVKWNNGSSNLYTNGSTVYGLEDDSQTSSTSKIGLIHLSDFYYAYNKGGTIDCYNNICQTWMVDTSTNTWTMTRRKIGTDGVNYIWGMTNVSTAWHYYSDETFGIRPVFYLNSDEQYISGDGTIDNPIILNEPKIPIGEYLLANPTTGLNTTTPYSGMYRYIGTSANNYVKLGNVLYRVIGITSSTNNTLGLESGQLKLIKASTNGNYNWHTDYNPDIKWESSAMFTYLQGTSVLGSTSIVPSGWSDKISSVKWNIGDVNKWTNGSIVYGLEDDTTTSSTSKIGLMYLSDYFYAYTAGGTTNCGSYSCTNWITSTSQYEWTMIRYGHSSGLDGYHTWIIGSNGYAGKYNVTNKFSIRPVFYLTNDVYITNPEATGTSTDPFILAY